MSPLVSIMTPCYNGENFVGRYLDSVLAQTYDNIELVIVNDGSTDKTAEIITSYVPKFEKKGYKLICVQQENGGVSSAINAAMPLVNGDFITWFDSDDFYTPDSIEKRVNFLQENPQYDFCMCQMYVVNENDLTKVTDIMCRQPLADSVDNFFMDLLIQRNVVFPNVYLVRRNEFFKAHPTKNIFNAQYGQNWQLLLPLAYQYKYGYINEPLCVYVVRSGSICHSPRSLQQQVERNFEFIDLLIATIKPLHAPNEAELLNYIWVKYLHQNLVLGIKYCDMNLIYDCLEQAQEMHLDILGEDVFDVEFLLAKYILPLIELQNKLESTKNKLKKLAEEMGE